MRGFSDGSRPAAARRDPFVVTESEGTSSFSQVVRALRAAQEAITRSRPTADESARMTGLLEEVSAMARPGVAEGLQLAGQDWSVAGRDHPMPPPIHYDEVTPTTARGHVTFGRFHGGVGTVHGGVLPIVFDEIMGRLATSDGRPFARTASMKVDYRAGVPVETRISVTAELESIERRKVWVRGALHLEDRLLTECRGLWVLILPDSHT